MWFGGMGMFLFWGVLIGAIVWAVRRITGNNASENHEDQAMQTARNRLANGEITTEEFEELMITLQKVS